MRRLLALIALALALPVIGSPQQSVTPCSETLPSAVACSVTINALCGCGAVAGGSVAPSSLLTGLVSYWPLDELSGTRYDATDTGNDLTDNNTVTYQLWEPFGAVAKFTAANSESLTKEDPVDMDPGHADFAVTGWVNFQDDANNQFIFDLGINSGSLSQCALTISRNSTGLGFDGTGKLNVTIGNGTTFQYGTWPQVNDPVLVVGDWHFLYVEYDATAGTLKLHVDGSLAITVSAGAGYPLTLGASAYLRLGALTTNLYASVLMSRFGYWNRVLTAAERACLYNGGTPPAYPFTGVCN
jgi:hypothetical protein